MQPKFYKTGIINTSEFIESDASSVVVDVNTYTKKLVLPYSYVPAKDTNNSCLRIVSVEYDTSTMNANTVLHIVIEVSWSGFDDSSTAGTFDFNWNSYRLKREDGSTVWSSPLCNALNAKQNLKSLVLSSTSGTYTYDIWYTPGQSCIDTYSYENMGVRANYSNGIGRFSINKVSAVPKKYYTDSITSQRFANNYTATQEFIEI